MNVSAPLVYVTCDEECDEEKVFNTISTMSSVLQPSMLKPKVPFPPDSTMFGMTPPSLRAHATLLTGWLNVQ